MKKVGTVVLKKKAVDVAIIGAGLSGLYAARELKKTTLSFAVLEAQQRVGGRVLSSQDHLIGIDLGAQWISSHHHRMKKLIDEFGLKTIKTFQKGKTIYHFRGKTKIVGGSFPPISKLAIVDLFQFKKKVNEHLKKLSNVQPWETDYGQKLDEINFNNYIQANMFTDEGKAFVTLLIEEETCIKTYAISALDVLWFIKSAGSVKRLLAAEDEWLEAGTHVLVSELAKTMEGQLILGEPVERIEYAHDQAMIFTKNQMWQAKKVIITVPPQLSKKIVFQPPLTEERKILENGTVFPNVIKMIFVYDHPFWREKGLNGTLYSDKGPINVTMDSSPADESKGVLTVICIGEDAQIFSKMGQEYRKNETLKVLAHYLGNQAKYPINFYEKDWSEVEWIEGGYASHFAPGTLTKAGMTLTAPIGPLHWAGSETAEEWRLYMEGALQSGARAAQEVVKELNK